MKRMDGRNNERERECMCAHAFMCVCETGMCKDGYGQEQDNPSVSCIIPLKDYKEQVSDQRDTYMIRQINQIKDEKLATDEWTKNYSTHLSIQILLLKVSHIFIRKQKTTFYNYPM